MLDAVSHEHAAVAAALDEAKGELVKVQGERDKLLSQVRDQEARAAAAEAREAALLHSWGHRLQVWVTAGFWLIVALVFAHFAFGVLGLLVTGPAGAVFAAAGAIANPLAWFQWLRDHIWYNHVAAAAAVPK